MGLLKSLKAAFLNRWNLLICFGAAGFSVLSGRPDIALPLVLAGEVGYLGFLATHPKFQQYVAAQEAKESRQGNREAASVVAKKLLAELPRKQVARFEALRTRCTELQSLARQMRDPEGNSDPAILEGAHAEGLERLLWMYLRLLFTHYSMSQFLEKTSAEQIENDIHLQEERLKALAQESDGQRRQRLTKVVEENLTTSRTRLDNYNKARESYELMGLELDRLENTIHSLNELAVNRQDPEFISSQIDQAANSMVQTEKTMGELSFVTGLKLAEEDVPPMLHQQMATVSR